MVDAVDSSESSSHGSSISASIDSHIFMLITLSGSSFVYKLKTENIPTAQAPALDDPRFFFNHPEGAPSMINDPSLLPERLDPPPPATPPEPWFCYPQAEPHMHNTTYDKRYASGWYYYTDYFAENADKVKQRMLRIITPPNTGPEGYSNDRFTFKDIPGMLRLIPGVPFVARIGGSPLKEMTVACLHTLHSLIFHPEFNIISSLSHRLRDIAFGIGSQPAIYEIEGLKRNMRSQVPKDGLFDGSYSLTSTVEQGQGRGTVKPALQVKDIQITKAATIIHKLYRLIMPYCLSTFEMSVLDWRSIDMNIFNMGGLAPGPISIQMNASSAANGGGLSSFIGVLQGKWHVDISDDPSHYTFLVMIFRLPPGTFLLYFS